MGGAWVGKVPLAGVVGTAPVTNGVTFGTVGLAAKPIGVLVRVAVTWAIPVEVHVGSGVNAPVGVTVAVGVTVTVGE